MTERIIRAVAGSLILISLALGVWVNHYWLILTAFVGLNLLQSSISRFCPLEYFLKKKGFFCCSRQAKSTDLPDASSTK